MTNAERHEARYQRRKAARLEKRQEKVKDAMEFDKVFSFIHLYNSAQKCFKGVRWKASVQSYKSRCGMNVYKLHRRLMDDTYRMKRTPEFYVRERGRERKINSIGITDRVPQKCNSKYALKPVLHRSLIYDNYASQEGKGTTLARKRLKKNLLHHIRKYGMKGGVIILDFHHYFESIRHEDIESMLRNNFTDERIIDFNMKIVKNDRRERGVVLGSENSQDFAVSIPNALDHYVKEKLRVDFYGRFNDDICITDHDYEKLKDVFAKIKDFLKRIGIELNEKKSRILHFGKPFTVLKRKYTFTETGGIIIRPARESVIRERRKLKKLYRKVLHGDIELRAATESLQAWKASVADTRCWKIVDSMNRLYNELFINRLMFGEGREMLCITS